MKVHRLAREVVHELLLDDRSAEHAIGFPEFRIEIRECAAARRGARLRSRRAAAGLSPAPVPDGRARRRIGIDIEQAQDAQVRVVHVEGPHEIDQLSRREMALERVVLVVADLRVIPTGPFCVSKRRPLPIRKGRTPSPGAEIHEHTGVRPCDFRASRHHLRQPKATQIEQAGVGNLPRQGQ